MATASSQASTRTGLPSTQPPPPLLGGEIPTVEESPEELDLIGILRRSVFTGSQPIEAILASVADAARVMSGADGTAIALETKGTIVCRARSGTIAPPLGAAISTDSGISGECLRGATTLVCHDTLNDPRVDSEVCQALGIRSIAAIPLLEEKHGVGIVEAFSARPDAFDGDALSSLRGLAEVAQIAYLREHAVAPTPAPAPIAADPVEVASVTRAPIAPAPVAPAPVAADFVAPAQVVLASVAPAPVAPSSDPLAPFRQAVRYVPRKFTAEELAPEAGLTKKYVRWGAVIAIGLLVTAAVAWWSWHSPDEGATSTQTAHAATVANVNASASPHEVLPKPVAGVSGKRTSSRPETAVQNAAEIQPLQDQAEEAAVPAPTSATSASVKGNASEAEVIEAPTVSISSAANPEQLARLTSAEAQLPAGGPVVSQGVVEPVLLHKVDPSYPLQARTQRLSGKVVLTATIGVDGSIREITVLSGPEALVAAAKSAVHQWRYRPATLNGTPVEVQKDITFLFQQP